MATRAEWTRRLSRWKKSGKSAEEFAAKEKLDVKLLKWWRWKVGPPPAEPSTTLPPRFLPVHVVDTVEPPTGAPSPIEIALPNGRVVRVAPGFDSRTLARVLSITAEDGPC
jgi:transposase